ncbi:MAG: TolC family protein [Desulfobacterales bacterium]|nr:TolC family protein [Desulfobacterales bacterium]
MKQIYLFMLLFFTIPFYSDATDVIKKGETINLKRCIQIAQKNHPEIIAAKNKIDVNENRISEAKSSYYPQINGNIAYNRISSGKITNNSSNQYTSSVNLNQNLYDFNKTDLQVRIQKLNRDVSSYDFERVLDQVIFNVKQSYYGFLQAKRNNDVAKESINQFEQHLEQAQGFFKVGVKPKFDVTKAQVDLGTARLNFIKTANALKTAKIKLDNSMGIINPSDYEIEDNLYFEKYAITLEEAINIAYKKRSDLKSIIFKKEVGNESIKLAKKAYYPVVSGNMSLGWGAEDFPLENSWNIGLAVSIPIFNGFLTINQIKEANSNLKVLEANEEYLRQQIFLEIKQAYLNLQQAEEAIQIAKLSVSQAEENLSLADNRYKTGAGSLLEVTDAEISYSSAKKAYIQSLYDYKLAQANLEEAMSLK